MTTVFGENSGLLHNGALLRGGEPEEPLIGDPFVDTMTLRSGIALRTDDLWRSELLRELGECEGFDVAHVPQDPIAGFLDYLRRPPGKV